jgi:hypothetical protein
MLFFCLYQLTSHLLKKELEWRGGVALSPKARRSRVNVAHQKMYSSLSKKKKKYSSGAQGLQVHITR